MRVNQRSIVMALLCALVVAGGTGAALATEVVVTTGVMAVEHVVPVYPPAAKAAGFHGSVTLSAEILADGTVGTVSVLESTRPRLGFEAAATDAVRQWRFAADQGGETIEPTTAVVTLRFDAPTRHYREGYVAGRVEGLFSSEISGDSLLGMKDQWSGGSGELNHMNAHSDGRSQFQKAKLPPRGGMYDRRSLQPDPPHVGNLPTPVTPERR